MDESFEQTALRKVLEESGYSEIEVITDLGEQLVEFDHDGRHFVRTERYFLMATRVSDLGPRTQGELQFNPVWLNWEEAMEKLTFDAEREWVRRAHEFLNKQ
jgi:hypothetical protein